MHPLLSLQAVLCFGLLGLSSFVARAQEQTLPSRPVRITSSDERVIVDGLSSTACSVVLTEVTALREEFHHILKKVGDTGGDPIFPLNNNLIINLAGAAGDPPPLNNYVLKPRPVENTTRFRMELNIHLARGLDRSRLRESVVKALLMDRSLNDSLQDDQQVRVAPWLIAGVLERMAWRAGETDRGLYKALFRNDIMMDVEELITLDDPSTLDAAERTTFRVSAGAFVMAMLKQDDGSETFLNYLTQAPTYEGEPLLLFLNSFFTGGLSEQGLAKWWALQLADLTQDFVTKTLTPLETEKALDGVLRGGLEDEDGNIRLYRLAAFRDILASPKKSADCSSPRY